MSPQVAFRLFLGTFLVAVVTDIVIANTCLFHPLIMTGRGKLLLTLSGYMAAVKNVADSPADIVTWTVEKCYSLVLLAYMYSPSGCRVMDVVYARLGAIYACIKGTLHRSPSAPRGYGQAAGAGSVTEPLLHRDEESPASESAQLEARKQAVAAIQARYKWARWWVRRTYDATLLALGVKVLCVAVVGGLETHPHPSDVPLKWIWAVVGSTFALTTVQRVSLLAVMQHYKAEALAPYKGKKKEKQPQAPTPDASLSTPLLQAADDEPSPSTEPSAPDASRGGAEGKDKEDKEGEDEDLDVLLEQQAKNAATFWELVKLSGQDWPMLSVAFAAGILAAFAGAWVPYYLGKVINSASIDASREVFLHTTIRMLVCAGTAGVFTGIRGGVFSFCMTRLNIRIRTRVICALMKQELGFFDVSKTGDITSRLNTDTVRMADQISLNVNVFLRSIVSAALVLAFMFHASWRLTIVTFVMVPLQLSVSKVYGTIYRRINKGTLEELAGANSVAEEALSTMATVRSFAAEDVVVDEYVKRLIRYWKYQNQEATLYAVYASIATVLPTATTAAVLYFGGLLVLDKKLSPGSLVSFMLYQQSLTGSFAAIGDVFGGLTAAIGAAEKVFELLNRQPKVPDAGSYIPPSGELRGEVELRDVVFSYPARPEVTVLKGLSLRVPAGEVVALVGASGGGKSSIIKLIERFYVPTSGSVLIDGVDVGAYEPKWLKRHMGLVQQEPVLYGRSIKRNILYGLETDPSCPTDEDIEKAARQANCFDFISRLPKGFETECGEKGVALSGGEKQRVAICRALVRRSRIILLDEATSALDAESEGIVQAALDTMIQQHGQTIIVIAHRLSTVRNADRICVIGGGTIQETGTHDELLANEEGLYSKLVRKQMQKTPTSASSGGLDLLS